MLAECGHEGSDMVMIDSEPLDDCHTAHIFKCTVCGAKERIVETHERITDLPLWRG